MEHEEAVVRAFFPPQRRERYLGFLSTKKGRAKFISELWDFNAVDPKRVVAIPPSQQNRDSIAKLLSSMGAPPMCWVMSENIELDARELELEIALRATVGYEMGTIISCIPGKLAYFEDEGERFILRR
ncbi:MAG: hypothetical protein ACRD50_00650 [Candidatus Acidiferrales bacterium]